MIAAASMTAGAEASPPLRYERKFVADGSGLPETLALVRRQRALFRPTFPDRMINNVYFDSPELKDYFAHVGGAAERAKTRVRWYGELAGRVAAPTLEIKFKRGLVSGKKSFRLAAWSFDAAPSPAAESLAQSLAAAGLAEDVRAALCHRAPVLLNRYRRFYFQSADGRFRLTVDGELQFAAWSGGRLALARVPGVIVEIKYEPRHADAVERITGELPFRLTRSSKYVLGVERVLAF
jgi:hypothetical protein